MNTLNTLTISESSVVINSTPVQVCEDAKGNTFVNLTEQILHLGKLNIPPQHGAIRMVVRSAVTMSYEYQLDIVDIPVYTIDIDDGIFDAISNLSDEYDIVIVDEKLAMAYAASCSRNANNIVVVEGDKYDGKDLDVTKHCNVQKIYTCPYLLDKLKKE